MSGLFKVTIVFAVCVISFILLAIAYRVDEYSPFVPIFASIGVISFAVSLIGFLII